MEEMLHGTKYGGLGLRAQEAGKASLLYKWIVKAMEHGESNLQLVLRYKLAMLIPKEVDVKGFILVGLFFSNTNASLGLRYGGTSIRPKNYVERH